MNTSLRLNKVCYLFSLCKISPDCTKRLVLNIGIKHGFPCINVCLVPREVLKTEAEGRGFQQLPRDLTNVNALENND